MQRGVAVIFSPSQFSLKETYVTNNRSHSSLQRKKRSRVFLSPRVGYGASQEEEEGEDERGTHCSHIISSQEKIR